MKRKRLVIEQIALSALEVVAARKALEEKAVGKIWLGDITLNDAQLHSVQFISSDSNLLMPPDAVIGKLVIEYASICGAGEGS